VFLILNSMSSVTGPELIRPSIPIMTHSLDQKVVARKAKARKCAAEVAGNVQAKVERQHRLLISFSVIPPSTMVTMVTIGGDLQPGCLADRLLTGLGQPQINP